MSAAGLLAGFVRGVILGFARLLTAPRAFWVGVEPRPVQRVYAANHASHADFILILAVLPRALRARARPVAAAEYWTAGPVRRFVAARVFRAVLIERDRARRTRDPVAAMVEALDEGDSLILFPEGTRNLTEEALLPLKAGLSLLAEARPGVEVVPVWIENLNRVLPKGEVIPLPLICTVSFGAPLPPGAGLSERAREALLALRAQARGAA